MEPNDYYDAPRGKVLYFIRGVGLIRGWSKGEAQYIFKGRGARAGFCGPPFIDTYLHTYEYIHKCGIQAGTLWHLCLNYVVHKPNTLKCPAVTLTKNELGLL
jgi:hypothetical protein